MDISPREIERMKQEEEEEKRKSLERKKQREIDQTQVVRISLRRRNKTFGLGIADTDGHCLVHRLVRNEYYSHDDAIADDPENANNETPRLRLGDRIIKVGDSIVVDYYAAVAAVKATPDVLELTVLRDPNAEEPLAWLRDRIYNYSKPLYWSIVSVLATLAAMLACYIIYLIATMEGPPPAQSKRHEYKYPFGNHPKEDEDPPFPTEHNWEDYEFPAGGFHGGMMRGGMIPHLPPPRRRAQAQ